MPKLSAGLMMYRKREGISRCLSFIREVRWAQKNLRIWTIPKGEFEGDEAPLDAARHEF
jgi:predicted NUDIX family NTP pyrophosphohydrolase